MVVIIFLVIAAILVVAGIFISMEAKRRRDGKVERPKATMTDDPSMGRAHGPED